MARLTVAVFLVAVLACGASSGAGAQQSLVDETMSSTEMAARLLAGSPRAESGEPMESEWQDPALACMTKRGVRLVEQRPRLQLKVHFEFGSARVSGDSTAVLDNLASALADPSLEDDNFVLAGHTDAVGSDAYNTRLSRARAASVRDYLVGRGVDPERLRMVGCGERVLLDQDRSDAAINRRVEIINGGR